MYLTYKSGQNWPKIIMSLLLQKHSLNTQYSRHQLIDSIHLLLVLFHALRAIRSNFPLSNNFWKIVEHIFVCLLFANLFALTLDWFIFALIWDQERSLIQFTFCQQRYFVNVFLQAFLFTLKYHQLLVTTKLTSSKIKFVNSLSRSSV